MCWYKSCIHVQFETVVIIPFNCRNSVTEDGGQKGIFENIFNATAMNEALLKEITETFSKLIHVFSKISNAQVDVVPFEGSWTAGQVAEHIVKAVSGMPELLNAQVEPANRPYDEQVEGLKKVFLDFNLKMKSPEFIVPTETQHDQADLLKTFSRLGKEMEDAAINLDLTLLCKAMELPGNGYLTRFEWLSFALVHTQRHIHQLQKIGEKLKLK